MKRRTQVHMEYDGVAEFLATGAEETIRAYIDHLRLHLLSYTGDMDSVVNSFTLPDGTEVHLATATD